MPNDSTPPPPTEANVPAEERQAAADVVLPAPVVPVASGLFLWLNVALAALALAASRLGVQVLSGDGPVSPIYLPAGICTALLMLFGWRFWGAILFANLALNALTVFDQGLSDSSDAWLTAILTSLGTTVEAVAGASLIPRACVGGSLPSNPRQWAQWMGSIALISALSAAMGGVNVAWSNPNGREFWVTTALWWAGDFNGIATALLVLSQLAGARLLLVAWSGRTALFLAAQALWLVVLWQYGKSWPEWLSLGVLLLLTWLSPLQIRSRWALVLAGVVPTLVVLGTSDGVWVWGSRLPPAQTLAGFALLATAGTLFLTCFKPSLRLLGPPLVSEVRRELRRHISGRPFANGLRTTAVGLLGVLALALWLSRHERAEAMRVTRLRLEQVGDSLGAEFRAHLNAQRRLAARWEVGGEGAEEARRADASLLLEDYRSIAAVERLDPQGVVRWVEPLPGNERLVGTNPNAEGPRQEALETARQSRMTSVSELVDLVEGGRGFLTMAGLGSTNRLEGFVAFVFRVEDLFRVSSGRLKETLRDYRVALRAGSTLLFESRPAPTTSTTTRREVSIPLPMGNREWLLELIPTGSAGSLRLLRASVLLLLAGTVFGLLTGVLAFFQQRARQDAANALEAQRIAQIGSWEWNLSTGAEEWSDQLFQMLGYEPHGVPPTREQFLAAIVPEERERVRSALEALPKEGPVFELNFARRTPNGRLRYLHCFGQVFRSDDNLPLRVVATIQDVTTDREAEETLRGARDAAEAASRAKSEFLAAMSHEIRTPMNGILGMTEILQQTSLDVRQRDLTDTVAASGQALLAIINDILDFSKVEAGQLRLIEDDFELRPLVEDVMALIVRSAPPKSVELAAIVSRRVPDWFRGDPGRLRQILLNLVGNGFKFTQTGSVVLRVDQIRGPTGANHLRFQIKDTGIGIPENKRSLLFRPFQQVDSSDARRYQGTGLGLAICHRLVSTMRGSIGVESAPGQGSNFFFDVPLPPVSRPPASASPQAPLPDLRLVIASPNSFQRECLLEMAAHLNLPAVAHPTLTGLGAIIEQSPRLSILLVDDAFGTGPLFQDGWIRGSVQVRVAMLEALPRPTSGRHGNLTSPFRSLSKPIKSAHLRSLILELASSEAQELVAVTSANVLPAERLPVEASVPGSPAVPAAPTSSVAPPVAPNSPAAPAPVVTPPAPTANVPPPPEPVPSEAATPLTAPPTPPAPPAPPAVDLKGLRVLVVEEQPVNRRLALLALGKLGCRAEAVDAVADAARRLQGLQPEVVLFATSAPDPTLASVISELRSCSRGQPQDQPAAVIAVVSAGGTEQRQRFLDAGFDGYLEKPFNVAQIRGLLEETVRQRPRTAVPV